MFCDGCVPFWTVNTLSKRTLIKLYKNWLKQVNNKSLRLYWEIQKLFGEAIRIALHLQWVLQFVQKAVLFANVRKGFSLGELWLAKVLVYSKLSPNVRGRSRTQMLTKRTDGRRILKQQQSKNSGDFLTSLVFPVPLRGDKANNVHSSSKGYWINGK